MKRFFCLFLIIASCNRPEPHRYIPHDYEKDADKVTAQVAKKLRREKGLKLIGTGGGMMGQIHCMAMSFSYYGDLSIETSRELLVYCVEEYLAAINADEKIRPHLSHYPFTAKGIELRILVHQKDGREPEVGALSVVGQISGKLTYKICIPGVPSLKEILREPYEEGKQLVSNGLNKAE